MTNQFDYQASFSRDYMMEADYDMALMMKDDCIKQLMALRELQYIMAPDEHERLRFVIRENLLGAEGDIYRYESRHGKPNGSLDQLLNSAI